MIAENYGYQVTTFAASIMSSHRISRLDKTLKISYKVGGLSYIWQVLLGENCYKWYQFVNPNK